MDVLDISTLSKIIRSRSLISNRIKILETFHVLRMFKKQFIISL